MNMTKNIVLVAGLALAGSASAQTYTQAFGGMIPDDDAAGTTFVMSVPGHVTIGDINVGFGITHTWQGDLIVTIEHNGTTVGLVNRAGDGNDNGGAGFLADNYGDAAGNKFFLDDSASEAYDAAAPNGYGNLADQGGIDDVTGSWLPYDAGGITSLAAFNGMDAQGNWTFFVSDNAFGDTGTFDVGTLDITAIPAPASLALLGLGGLAATRRRR